MKRRRYRKSPSPTVTMSRSACEKLPQELIADIVDNIRDEFKSLKAFSLVCKAWTDPARYHLFASLTIGNMNELRDVKRAKIISAYAPFLRDLRLASTTDHHKFWREVIFFLADFKTPRLRSLELSSLTWHSLSPAHRSAFLSQFKSIVSLRLKLYKPGTSPDIATIICSFPHLRKLILRNTRHKDNKYLVPSPVSPELRSPEQLSTLCVRCIGQDHQLFLKWLGSIPGQRSIHTLDLSLHSIGLDNTSSNFSKALGPSLEVLKCSTDNVLDLQYNTRLRHLDLSFYTLLSPHNVLFAKLILSGIRSPQLEEVIFRIELWFKAENYPEWIEVDSILAGPRFAMLKNICIYTTARPLDVTSPSALFAIWLPRCQARGILSFIDLPYRS